MACQVCDYGAFHSNAARGGGAGDLCFANNWQREGGRMGGKIFSSEGIGSLCFPPTERKSKKRSEGLTKEFTVS